MGGRQAVRRKGAPCEDDTGFHCVRTSPSAFTGAAEARQPETDGGRQAVQQEVRQGVDHVHAPPPVTEGTHDGTRRSLRLPIVSTEALLTEEDARLPPRSMTSAVGPILRSGPAGT